MAHRCCGWLDLRRGAVAIGVFYVCYLLLVALTLAVLAGVLAAEAPLAGRLGLAAGGALLLALLAGGLLLGAARRRRPLLLLWLLTYGAVLLTLTVGVFGLAIAAETGHRTFLTEFCESRPAGRCSFRLFHYLLLLFAIEWYWWAVVLLRYRQLGREECAQHSETPLGVPVRGAHSGQRYHVPVTYCGDGGLLKPPADSGDHRPAAVSTGPSTAADLGRPPVVVHGW
ncbi:hypothetical protein FJT64_024462 [Amphibalanus amphitrite]|uniref:Uncharacterized protein n=1 Tax=Amphibalanus amphitrite TaxID=1232801 RepID=A0A6A4W8B7_AMPAM|nr:hypothetical protein FJT64_024462 [Amphibalanus amphitrite]